RYAMLRLNKKKGAKQARRARSLLACGRPPTRTMVALSVGSAPAKGVVMPFAFDTFVDMVRNADHDGWPDQRIRERGAWHARSMDATGVESCNCLPLVAKP